MRSAAALFLAVGLSLSGCGRGKGERPEATIGLFTSLPLVWGENDDIAGALNATSPPGWVSAELAHHGRIVPLDSLTALNGGVATPKFDLLILAQPRPLSPDENVALDGWVRGGGRVLLFADPMLTRDSRYPLGDPRRPQDTVMLSPILARWGLRLEFDEAQVPGPRAVPVLGLSLPVQLAGRFALLKGGECHSFAQGLGVNCRIGRGSALAVADAALLDDPLAGDDGRAAVLDRLVAKALR